MADKVRIILPISTHRPGKEFAPYNATAGLGFTDDQGHWQGDALPITLGNSDDIEVIESGTPFEIDAEEGAKLIKRFGGCYVDPLPKKG